MANLKCDHKNLATNKKKKQIYIKMFVKIPNMILSLSSIKSKAKRKVFLFFFCTSSNASVLNVFVSFW